MQARSRNPEGGQRRAVRPNRTLAAGAKVRFSDRLSVFLVVARSDRDLLLVDRSSAVSGEGGSDAAEQHRGHRVGARSQIGVRGGRPRPGCAVPELPEVVDDGLAAHGRERAEARPLCLHACETVNAGWNPFLPVTTIPPVPADSPSRLNTATPVEYAPGAGNVYVIVGVVCSTVSAIKNGVELPAELGHAAWRRDRLTGVERHVGPVARGDRLLRRRRRLGKRHIAARSCGCSCSTPSGTSRGAR